MTAEELRSRQYLTVRELAEFLGVRRACALRRLRRRGCLQRQRVRPRRRIWIHWNSLLPLLEDRAFQPERYGLDCGLIE